MKKVFGILLLAPLFNMAAYNVSGWLNEIGHEFLSMMFFFGMNILGTFLILADDYFLQQKNRQSNR